MRLYQKLTDPIYLEEFYSKNNDLHKADVELLKKWCMEQPHLPDIPEILIIFCLHSCYYKVEVTKKCLHNFMFYRAKFPEFFSERDPRDPALQDQFSVVAYVLLPSRTRENYDVMYSKLLNPSAGAFHMTTQFKIVDMCSTFQAFRRGLSDGMIAIIDCAGASFGHLFKINLLATKRFFTYIQESLPVRLKAIHIVNVNYIVDKSLSLVKPFIKKEHLEIVHFHQLPDTLYEYIDQDVLPNDVGGTAGPALEMHKTIISDMQDNSDFFDLDEELKANLALLPHNYKI